MICRPGKKIIYLLIFFKTEVLSQKLPIFFCLHAGLLLTKYLQKPHRKLSPATPCCYCRLAYKITHYLLSQLKRISPAPGERYLHGLPQYAQFVVSNLLPCWRPPVCHYLYSIAAQRHPFVYTLPGSKPGGPACQ